MKASHVSVTAVSLGLTFFLLAVPGFAQDTRKVVEPKIPPSCAVLPARIRSIDGVTLSANSETTSDTARIQQALDRCPAGQGVELRKTDSMNAFLSGPLQLRNGVTLVIAKDAILFASRNPRDYDINPGSC